MSSHVQQNVLQKLVAVKTEIAADDQEAINSPNKINDLAIELHFLKSKAKVLALQCAKKEAELLLLCGSKEEGTSKFDTEQFKISTVGKLNRKIVDLEVLRKLAPEVIGKPKYDLDLTMFKLLATSNPPLFAKALHCIETKPAKTAVKVELIPEAK
tara:strand:+ start:188976 stop:189443 length:468 start_codon:yes stop_codon:yes gene_type:complete